MTTKLTSLKIGPITIELPVVLASLAGYSDLPYRLICRRGGADYCASEMMLDRLLVSQGRQQSRLLKLTDADHPIAGQLIGNDPQVFASAARVLAELGFDVIDLNFACPVRKALSRRRGGHLMRMGDLAIAIVREVVAAVDRPVTLKLRKSFSQDGHDGEEFWRIATAAFDAGVAAITVHARSVEVKYAGPADWEFLAAVKRRFSDRTIIGSGDVLRPADALRMLAVTGVDGVAAARGALGNPWFFRQVRDLLAGRQPYQPSLAEQRRLMQAHFDDVCKLYGPDKGPKLMRKFGIKYARMHPSPKQVRMAFAAAGGPADWRRVLEDFYDSR